MLGTTVQ
nr:unnamed protein product [Callosobruchus chinensis]CAH7747059.1 unnamed protein product [Callosobruchus chinensis]